MKELVCENNSSGINSPFMLTDCLAELIKGLNIARQRVWEYHSSGIKSLVRQQVVWRNNSEPEQKTEEQNTLKTCTKSPKKETPQIYGSLTATCYSEESLFKSHSQKQQLASSSNQRTQSLEEFLTNTWLGSIFSAQLCLNCIIFQFCMRWCTTTIKLKILLMILRTLQFTIFCARKLIFYQIAIIL